MNMGDTDLPARLEAWRVEGADRMDPVRFQRIDALARRAAGHRGAIRSVLDARVAELVSAYANDLAAASTRGIRHDDRASPAARTPSPMTALLEYLAGRNVPDRTRTDPAAASAPPASDTLDAMRRLCTEARSASQVRQALEQAPENAGPLNSARLVHRTLTLMHEVSPDYLQSFMAYVDTLAWLEGMGFCDERSKGTPSTASGGKHRRGQPRSRRA